MKSPAVWGHFIGLPKSPKHGNTGTGFFGGERVPIQHRYILCFIFSLEVGWHLNSNKRGCGEDYGKLGSVYYGHKKVGAKLRS
jgi:hypothetical protein